MEYFVEGDLVILLGDYLVDGGCCCGGVVVVNLLYCGLCGGVVWCDLFG